MWFHLFVGNHDPFGRATLFDMIEWLAGSLTELKHHVTVGETIAPNAMNVIWENFADADAELFQGSFRFGLIATEVPVGRSFNWLDADPWLTRRRAFDKIAPRAQFIWSMIEEPVETYARWAPSGFLELGFLESIVDPVFSRDPEFDFGFYGVHITPYRRMVLDRLSKHFTIAVPNRFLLGSDLNRFIASFKVGICLKHSPQWRFPSPGRIGRLLHAKRGIAAEFVAAPTRISALAPMARQDEDFADFCAACVNGSWKQRAEEAYEGFRTKAPMKDIMARLLDETLATAPAPLRGTILAPLDDGLRVSINPVHHRTDPVAEIHATFDSHKATLARLERERIDLLNTLKERDAVIEKLEQSLALQNAAQDADLAQYTERLKLAEHRHAQISNSRTWRATSPLRSFLTRHAWIRRVVGRMAKLVH